MDSRTINEHYVEIGAELIENESSAYEVMAKNWHNDTPKVNALKKYFLDKEVF